MTAVSSKPVIGRLIDYVVGKGILQNRGIGLLRKPIGADIKLDNTKGKATVVATLGDA